MVPCLGFLVEGVQVEFGISAQGSGMQGLES